MICAKRFTTRLRWTGPALVLGLTACGSPDSAPPRRRTAAIQEAQDAAWEVLRAGGTTSLGIAIGDAWGVIWSEGFGVADRSTGKAPGEDTTYGIGSVSKMFAAVAVMQLVEKGKVRLDEPVYRYVPGFTMADPRYRDITVHMLLDHSSGLMGTNWRNAFTTAAVPGYLAREVLPSLATQRLKAAPGFMNVYCNDGYTLTEAVVEAASGKPFARYVQDEILGPLQMTHSQFTLAESSPGTYARVYSSGVEQPFHYVNAYATGGLFSTPSDLVQFARIFLANGAAGGTRLLTPESVAAMAVDHTARTFDPIRCGAFAYGLGWDTVAHPGLRAVGVTGWTKGGASLQYLSELLVAPEAGLSVAVMGTLSSSFSPGTIAERVLLRALAEEGRIREYPAPLPAVAGPAATAPAGLTASIAGVYAGTYTSGGTFRIVAATDGSIAVDQWQGPDTWTGLGKGLTYRSDGWFTSDADPLVSYKVVDGSGTPYLARRGEDYLRGNGHQLDAWILGQRMEAASKTVLPAWDRRMGRWLVMNQDPVDTNWTAGFDPALFALSPLAELPGYLVCRGQLLDASADDQTARACVVVPQMWSRDAFDLTAFAAGGEERIRMGRWIAQPESTLGIVERNSTTTVTIGADGYGCWRRIPASTQGAVKIRAKGATAWKLYGPSGTLVATGTGDGAIERVLTLPSGSGHGYLLLLAGAGTPILLSVE